MEPKPTVRVGAYCRYSSHMQDEGFSIAVQHEIVGRAAERHLEWQITWYDEVATSAYTDDIAKRPIFQQLLEDVKADKLDLVVVHRLDRWARHLKTGMTTFELLRKCDVDFLSIEEQLDVTTPYGWLMFINLMANAQGYSMNLSKRVKEGQIQRAHSGLHAAFVPFGYRATGRKSAPALDRRETVGEWFAVVLIFELAASGLTVIEIAERLNDAGHWALTNPSRRPGREPRPFNRSAVFDIIRSPYYRPWASGDDRGTIARRGEEFRGQHEAAVSWELWHAANDCISGRRRGWTEQGRAVASTDRRAWPKLAEFRALVACAGCGRRLHVFANAAAGAEIYDRYVCPAHLQGGTCVYARQWARASDVRALWLEWADAHLQMPFGWDQAVRAAALRLAAASEEGRDVLRLARERDRWERRRKAAITLFRDGEMSQEDYRDRIAECDREIGRLAAAALGSAQHETRLLDAGRMVALAVPAWREAVDLIATPETDERIVRELILDLQRLASVLLEEGGLVVAPLGHRGLYSRWDQGPRPRSCELVEVRLREPYGELLAILGEQVMAS